MTIVTASAPGKAVLSGEYVVLDGAPAIATALNRRARIRLTSGPQEFHTVTAPGYLDGTWRFRQDRSGAFVWLDELPEVSSFALLENVWKRVSIDATLRLSLSIDSSEFFDSAKGLKLGIGSSAAVANALTQALCHVADGAIGSMGSFLIARDAHAAFQSGRGSGVDIAASFRGGLIEYRKGCDTLPARLAWPDRLACRFLWSGQPARTTAKLKKFQDVAHDSDSMAMLRSSAEEIASIWPGGVVDRIMDSFRHYIEALRQFDIDHELGIFDAGHAELAEMATNRNIVYKPCGAGGGDIGVVFAADEEAVIEFCEQAEKHNFVQLDMKQGAPGAEARTRKEFE
jgi:phosphomevalonate kinase